MIRPVIATLLSLGMAQASFAAEKTVRFGEIISGKDGNDTVRETTVLSLKENLTYGWIAKAKDGVRSVKVKEVIKIPKSGYNFNGQKVTPEKQLIEREMEIDVVKGFYGKKWKPDKTDPGGEYVITVTVDGEVLLETKLILLPP